MHDDKDLIFVYLLHTDRVTCSHEPSTDCPFHKLPTYWTFSHGGSTVRTTKNMSTRQHGVGGVLLHTGFTHPEILYLSVLLDQQASVCKS